MSRRRDTVTGDLFTAIPQPWKAEPGTMDFRTRVAALVSEMLDVARAKDPALDRYEIAARISRLVGKDVSKAMLDGYTAESRDTFNLPFWLGAAIEHVCHSTLLTDWHSEMRGGRFLPGAEAIDAEIARQDRVIELARDKQRHLREVRRRVR